MKSFEARVDLGCEFYVTAEAKKLDRVMVKVSRDYYVDLHPKEAIQYVDKKEVIMNKQIAKMTERACEIKANIVFVNEAIRELLNISEEKEQK